MFLSYNSSGSLHYKRTILVSGQLYLQTPFSRLEDIRLRHCVTLFKTLWAANTALPTKPFDIVAHAFTLFAERLCRYSCVFIHSLTKKAKKTKKLQQKMFAISVYVLRAYHYNNIKRFWFNSLIKTLLLLLCNSLFTSCLRLACGAETKYCFCGRKEITRPT